MTLNVLVQVVAVVIAGSEDQKKTEEHFVWELHHILKEMDEPYRDGIVNP